MKTKIWIEIEDAPIGEAVDGFCRIRRQVAGDGVTVIFKREGYFIESSSVGETPDKVYEKYRMARLEELERRKYGTHIP